MYCLKCGKETEDSHVFCGSCLESMKAYPIKPGTAVHLPHWEPPAADKKPPKRRRTLTPNEQILHLNGSIRWLTITIAVLFAVLCLVTAMLIHTLIQGPASESDLGRNYSSTISDVRP